ncbi:hypothetical protein [Algoriphagus machipongonensis]|uniref:Uncharacterized protein n=1 Tax=Algoriphagus machipongonensis TaxID=388413 RepID=A3HZ70_9BACT|nr:hypothetical protein [Algoriphagus machipongonensis]EAZ80556.1 hypothetical protein ALPR1_06520 [Algoriphagus machipongonensis]
MKPIFTITLFILVNFSLLAQVKFIERFEVPSEFYQSNFEIARSDDGIIAFRTIPEKGLNSRRKLQYFTTNTSLDSTDLIEFPVKEGFDILGYDLDDNFLFLLFQKGSSYNADKYIFKIDLDTKRGLEFDANNLLDMQLIEFLVEDDKAIFLGSTDKNPALQILDLKTSSVHTVQGIYNPSTQILQLRKVPEYKEIELVISKEYNRRSKEILINTYDLEGNLMREVKVQDFAQKDQEIMDALLLPINNYQQSMIGAFGIERRSLYQGMYVMDINEFGEYGVKLYTLEDFPNFYNYLEDKQKQKKQEEILKDIEKGKELNISNIYSIRDVYTTPEAYYVYFDHYNIVNARGSTRPGAYSPSSMYRYDRTRRMGYTPYFSDPFYQSTLPNNGSYQVTTEFHYISSHFAKIAKAGNVIWDNSSSYGDFVTTYSDPFGEMAVVGEDVYHMYVENLDIVASYFKNGEKIFENQYFEIELIDEEERIRDTDVESLRLFHWYDRYFLLSGMQKIRFLSEDGKEEVREVFFVSKILIDGDLYQPEEAQD